MAAPKVDEVAGDVRGEQSSQREKSGGVDESRIQTHEKRKDGVCAAASHQPYWSWTPT